FRRGRYTKSNRGALRQCKSELRLGNQPQNASPELMKTALLFSKFFLRPGSRGAFFWLHVSSVMVLGGMLTSGYAAVAPVSPQRANQDAAMAALHAGDTVTALQKLVGNVD